MSDQTNTAPSAIRSAVFVRVIRASMRYFFFELPFFLGTFAPDLRASESPIAIAGLRLVTFFPERPDFSFPCFFSRIARSTFSPAFLPYFAIATSCNAKFAKGVRGSVAIDVRAARHHISAFAIDIDFDAVQPANVRVGL